jgi:O-antigen/teichoic acid export membrane protein
LLIKYLNIIKGHFSLFVIAVSSLFFFLLNIILKESLSSNDYGLFSMFVTYISLLLSFGMFGFEQSLLRTSKIKSKLEIDKSIVLPSIISIVFFSLIGSYLMFENYEMKLEYFSLFIFSIFVILTKLSFNLYRLISSFTISQLNLNFWKISLFFIIGYCLVFDVTYSIREIFIWIILLFSINLVSFFGLLNKIRFVSNENMLALIKKSLLFFMILFTVSIIGYGDRLFIESRFGLSSLGDYFFYLNVFLFPFSLFQTYIGFKEIIGFKKKFSFELLKKRVNLIFRYSFIFSLILFFTFFLVDFFGIYNLKMMCNLDIILSLIFLGNIKIIYSLLSSAIGAVSDDNMLVNINFKSILSIIIISPFIYFFSFNIFITIVFVIILWIIRSFIWYNQLREYED